MNKECFACGVRMDVMIPKIIHYCWFGRGEYSELTKKCIKSWKEVLPEYEIKLWNEDAFDVESVMFTREAYEVKKYAFVADYVRLYALKKYGGIYFDTDVEVLRNLDELLGYCGFAGVEDTLLPACGILGCEPENPIISEFLQFYQDRSFYDDIGQYDMTPNPCHFAKILSRHGYRKKNARQHCGGFEVFPNEYFYPVRVNGEWVATPRTFVIHHYAGLWTYDKDERQRKFEKGLKIYTRFFGYRMGVMIYRNIIRLDRMGGRKWIAFCINKIFSCRKR